MVRWPRAPYWAERPRAHRIVCRRGAATFVLAPGGRGVPGDELRFRPLPVWPDARFIQIGSVDGTGRYTPFYPPAPGGGERRVPARGQALDGSIRLDAAPGPERLFVVLSATPLSEAAVRQAAEARARPVRPSIGSTAYPRRRLDRLPKRAEAATTP